MPYSESMEFVGEELMPPSWVEKGSIAFSLARMILAEMYSVD